MKAKGKLFQWLRTSLGKRLGRISPDKFYPTIDDMPIYNWIRVSETSDFGFILRNKTALNKFQKLFLAEVWKDLQDQYLQAFGIGEAMNEIIEKERKLILMLEDKNVNGNLDQLTFIEIEEKEIEELKKKISLHKNDFYVTKGKLEKVLKISIDMHAKSVREYYSYFKMLSDGHE